MFSMFSPDSKIMQFFSRFADLVVLNVLFLITCIPVFTAGAATTAMYTLCFRMVRDREAGIVKAYFRAFRDNFKQGTLLWLLELFILVPAFFYFDSFFAMEGTMRYTALVFLAVMMLAVLVFSYAFPWISQFQNDTRTTLKNALLLSIGHLPRSLCIAAIQLLPWIMMIANWDLFVQVSFLWLALYFAAAAYFNSSLLLKVFAPYIPEETK